MTYSDNEILEFCEENDVKFIKLAFCDAFGKQKNISIMRSELPMILNSGISFDASAVSGFGDICHSDLFLSIDKSSLAVLPWRPSHGRVARFFCDVKYRDGRPFESDNRAILRAAMSRALSMGIRLDFGAESEFYLFKTDEDGRPTETPLDNAGYIDAAPDDKGENVRREICLTLEEMGIEIERSHHEEGPGQNEVDFKYSDPMTSADNVIAFKAAVSSVAARNGLYASFMPKPIDGKSGNGFHINISISNKNKTQGEELLFFFLGGVMKRIAEITAFLNPDSESYKRLGSCKAPRYITWSRENRSQLIRIPATLDTNTRFELRSPDCLANPYIAFALLIHAGLDGIERKASPPEECNANLFELDETAAASYTRLPQSLSMALDLAKRSDFVKGVLPERIIECYVKKAETI